MSNRSHRLLRKRQNGDLPLSGSIVVGNPSPTASSLAQNTAAVDNPSVAQSGVPLVGSTPVASSPTAAAQSSTASSASLSATSSSNQIPISTVIGACIAAFIALSRNVTNNVSRRHSHREHWQRVNDGEDHWEGQQQQMKQRPPSGPMEKLGAMFTRTPSTTSAEKSSDGHNRESIGTMQHFTKSRNRMPARLFMGLSWDGETVGGDSFLSIHSRLPGTMSPTMMATAKSTPPAIASDLHRWESAEVMHVDGTSEFSEVGELRNPFADSASSVTSTTRGHNPFFNAQDKLPRRTLLSDTSHDPFADSHSESVLDGDGVDKARALQSLVAALGVPQEDVQERLRVASMQTSQYSRASMYTTGDDGEDYLSATAFPDPPTQTPWH
ncbi:hypothetical protein BU15DRAFT_89020 [Melanogaster broomeanus]|nr:hypothetical protein BU15DRAFT_89020 [Melanogaster broomeanus]